MNVCQELLNELKKIVEEMNLCTEEKLELLKAYLEMLEGCIEASGEIFEIMDKVDKNLKSIQEQVVKKLVELYTKSN